MENKSICAEAQMLIRRGVDKVFNAFIDPKETANFWLQKGVVISNWAKRLLGHGKCIIFL